MDKSAAINEIRKELENINKELIKIRSDQEKINVKIGTMIVDTTTMFTNAMAKFDMISNKEQHDVPAKRQPKTKKVEEKIEENEESEEKKEVRTFKTILICFNALYDENPALFDTWLTEKVKDDLEKEHKFADEKKKKTAYYKYMSEHHKDVLDRMKKGESE